MGPKKIKRALYEGKGIPAQASDAHVHEAMNDLFRTLMDKLNEEYRWMASCFVAVMAGQWGGDRRVKARLKLMRLINECRAHLQLSPFDPPEGWQHQNLYYGFGAIQAYAARSGKSIEQLIFEQFMTEGADFEPQR